MINVPWLNAIDTFTWILKLQKCVQWLKLLMICWVILTTVRILMIAASLLLAYIIFSFIILWQIPIQYMSCSLSQVENRTPIISWYIRVHNIMILVWSYGKYLINLFPTRTMAMVYLKPIHFHKYSITLFMHYIIL